MATKPYQMMRQARAPETLAGIPPVWKCRYELADTPSVSAQRERLCIRTHVSAPLPDHPQALVLAALLRVRELLDQQIRAMQSL